MGGGAAGSAQAPKGPGVRVELSVNPSFSPRTFLLSPLSPRPLSPLPRSKREERDMQIFVRMLGGSGRKYNIEVERDHT
eukprot:COSAG06_NODE_23034_length_704_cov_1.449587_1_plen_78_part_10